MATSVPFQSGSLRFSDKSLTGVLHSTTKAERIPAAAVIHSFVVPYKQDDGTDVAAAIVPLHIAQGSGAVKSIQISSPDAPHGAVGADQYTITVDLQKGDADPTAFATVLSSVITIPSPNPTADGDNDLTIYPGAFDGTKNRYDAGDVFQLIIAVPGSEGTKGQGLIVTTKFEEHPEND